MNHYTIKSMQESSAKYGACECCNQPASEVFFQRRYSSDSAIISGMAPLGSLFGHKECLEGARK